MAEKSPTPAPKDDNQRVEDEKLEKVVGGYKGNEPEPEPPLHPGGP